MRCEQMLPLIEKLADGEAAPSEKARAEAHMEACDSCRAHFRFLAALPEAARKAPLPQPPEMYWEVLPRKVMARIDKKHSPKSSPGRLAAWSGLRWLGAVAAAVIAVVVGLEVSTLRRAEAQAGRDSPSLERSKSPSGNRRARACLPTPWPRASPAAWLMQLPSRLSKRNRSWGKWTGLRCLQAAGTHLRPGSLVWPGRKMKRRRPL